MEKIKEFLWAIPPVAWIIIALLLIVGIWWISDDIGSAWERMKRSWVDEALAEREVEIDELKKERTALLQKISVLEASEQAKEIEADLLRQEAEKNGVNIQEAQDKIAEAVNEYQNDIDTIEKVKTGEISKLTLCEKQCKDSAELGYPCRANYCDKFRE